MAANKSKKILFFGFGYTAERLYKIMKLDGWEACASSRTPNSKKTNNIKFFEFDSDAEGADYDKGIRKSRREYNK